MATYYIGAQAFGINSLAHVAPGQKGWKKQNAKYIERYMGKNGKWQYVYDESGNGAARSRAARAIGINVRANRRREQAEADSYNTSKYVGRRTARQWSSRPVPHNTNPTVFYGDDDEARAARVSSNTAKLMRDPKNKATSAYLNTKVGLENTAHDVRDVANDTFDTIKREGARAISNGKKWLENLFNSITGGDARRRMEQARKDGDPAAFQQARAEYERSLAGRVSSLATRAWSTVKSTGSKVIERGREFLEKIVGNVREFATGERAMSQYRQMRSDGVPEAEARKASGLNNTLPGISANVREAADSAKAAVERAGSWLGDNAKKAAEAAADAVVKAGGAVLGIFNGPDGPQMVVQQNGQVTTVPIDTKDAKAMNITNGGPNAIRTR